MMHTKLIIAVALCMGTPAALAAQAEPAPVQMQQLQFLIGHWEGDGWRIAPDGARETFHETERVEARADGAALSIEGTGTTRADPAAAETVVHRAFGVVSFDRALQAFRWYAITSSGDHVDTRAQVGDHVLIWELAIAGAPTTRYTIRLDDRGRWFEIGEVSSDGASWQQVFEMTLAACGNGIRGQDSR